MKRVTWDLVLAVMVSACAGNGITDRVSVDHAEGLPDAQLAANVVAGGEVPANYLPTPSGDYYHATCIHEVPEEAHISPNGEVRVRGALVKRVGRCPYPRYRHAPRQGVWPTVDGHLQNAKTLPDGIGGDAYSAITADLIVPPDPAVAYSTPLKVYFSFPGLQPSLDQGPILQPVLTYGNQGTYGGAYWTMTPWYCDQANNNCYHGTVYPVQAGDTLHTKVTTTQLPLAVCLGTYYCWNISIQDARTGQLSTIRVTRSEAHRGGFGAADEVYALSSCSDFPSGATQYLNVKLYQWFYSYGSASPGVAGTVECPSWTLRAPDLSTTPWCGYDVWAVGTSITLSHN